MRCFPRCVLWLCVALSRKQSRTRLQRKAQFRYCLARSWILVLGRLAVRLLAVRRPAQPAAWRLAAALCAARDNTDHGCLRVLAGSAMAGGAAAGVETIGGATEGNAVQPPSRRCGGWRHDGWRDGWRHGAAGGGVTEAWSMMRAGAPVRARRMERSVCGQQGRWAWREHGKSAPSSAEVPEAVEDMSACGACAGRGETGCRLGCFGFVRFRLHKNE
jgi:hypothetical protein